MYQVPKERLQAYETIVQPIQQIVARFKGKA